MGVRTTLLSVGGMLLAVGGPIGYFSADDALSTVKKEWFSGSTDAGAAAGQPSAGAAASQDVNPQAAGDYLTGSRGGFSSHEVPTARLDEVLRFDVTVDWITRRWPRVSTGLPHVQLQGYRVPLISGTSLGDVAGSLTYFFNARQQVDRITLRGTTGDPGRLIALVSNRFHFVRRLTNDPGIAYYETVDSSNRKTGMLKIRTASTIDASRPYTRFEVDLLIDRPERTR